ncbi:AAA family ATPase [Tersicoccus sp. MR15.9]|uniref:helix-turn-helix transcriptional regulator n=1 Tax=Tersicoccus mangrovi TaxID=3121635 RepID=UPI002FE66F17
MSGPLDPGAGGSLVGRGQELSRLQRLVNDARRSRSSAAVLRGAPGVGKTALLEQIGGLCPDFRVLWVRSSSRLSTLPLGALSVLLGPLTSYLDRLSAPHRAAVEGALRLGPPVEGEVALAAGVVALLRIAARERPLLLLLDDAHHLDDGSRAVLGFVGTQLQNDPIVAFVAVPDGIRLDTDFEQIRVEGLGFEDARAMLAQHGLGLGHDVLTELVRVTAGNPLAILESARSPQISDLVLNDHARVPRAAATRLVRAYAHQFAALSHVERRAAVLIACEQRLTVEMLAGALEPDDGAAVDPSGADTALARATVDALIARDVLVDGGLTLDLRHPLIRQAVLAIAEPDEQRHAHEALARALAAQGWSDAALWQRVAAATGPDDELSAAVAAHAEEGVRRQDRSQASRSFEQAAGLSTDRHSRAVLYLQAAVNATHVSTRAGALLQEAMREADTVALREEIALYRALIHSWDGVEPPHPGPVPVALAPLHAAVRAQLMMVQLRVDEVPEAQARLASLPPELAAHPVAALVPVAHGMLAYLTGELTAADLDAVRRPLPTHEDVQDSLASALLLLFVQDLPAARAALAHGRQTAERTGGLAALPWLTACEAWIDVESGDLTGGLRRATEAVELAPVYSGRLCHALAAMVRMRALVHGGTPFETAMAPVPVDAPPLMQVLLDQLRAADLASRGHADEAVRILDSLQRGMRGRGLGGPLPLGVATDLAESQLHAGRVLAAQRTARRVLDALGDGPPVHPLAATLGARCRVICSSAEELDAFVADVLDGGPGRENAWVNAFLTLLVATRVAAGGLRTAAAVETVRRHATTAADAFEQLQAPHWHERAAALRDRATAAGGLADTRDRFGLTARESQIADQVLTGATTATIAERLHLSEKTVEGYLTRVYRKARVRSRAELLVRLQGGADGGADELAAGG